MTLTLNAYVMMMDLGRLAMDANATRAFFRVQV